MDQNLLNYESFTTPGTPEKWPPVENINTVASAAGLQPKPLAFMTHVSGAAAMTLIPLPWQGFAGLIAFVASGAFTGATGGVATEIDKPIAAAFTAVAGKVTLLCYSQRTGMWHPIAP